MKFLLLLLLLLLLLCLVQSELANETASHHHRRRHHHHHHHHHHHQQHHQEESQEHRHHEDDEATGAATGPAATGTATTGTTSHCPTCDVRLREEMRQRSLLVIKDQILSKLGMRAAPNITGRLPPSIPPLDYLIDRYGMQSDSPSVSSSPFRAGPVYDDEEDDFHARTEKVIAFAQPLDRVRNVLKSMEGMQSMYFKFSDKVTKTSKVSKAHLWLYLNGIPPTHHYHQYVKNSSVSVWIYTYKVVSVAEGESPVLTDVRKTKVAMEEKGGWVSLDCHKVVESWFRGAPEDNLGLAVQAVLSIDHNDLSSTQTPVKWLLQQAPDPADGSSTSSNAPFLEVVTTDIRKQRTKRKIGLNCDETSNENRCCRYPLTVDFVEFGWDWIIAPKKYEANYCSGECPYVFLQKYPHTHIVQQANPSGTAGPCCAPRKMSSISMLYFDTELNIIYGQLPGMVVDRCGCS